jgi:hypothetical protein
MIIRGECWDTIDEEARDAVAPGNIARGLRWGIILSIGIWGLIIAVATC